jgi:hypothetical protein
VPTLADRGCRVFSGTDPHGHLNNVLNNKSQMRKRRIMLLNRKYIIAYYIKLIKEERYFSKAKLYDDIFYLLLMLF